MASMKEGLAEQDKDFFSKGIKALEHRYAKCINPSGDYVEYSHHKNLANENALFFKIGPIKLELRDNFSQQQIIDNFLTILVSCQLNQRFYSIYLKKTILIKYDLILIKYEENNIN
jgi:hypothetical protein